MRKVPEGPFVVMFNEHQRLLMLRMFTVALADPAFKQKLLAEADPEGLQAHQFEAAHCLYNMTAALPDHNKVSDNRAWGYKGSLIQSFID